LAGRVGTLHIRKDAEARRTQAEVAKINALSEARDSAIRADAEALDLAKRTEAEPKLLLTAMHVVVIDVQ
jgi:hypothetical protein